MTWWLLLLGVLASLSQTLWIWRLSRRIDDRPTWQEILWAAKSNKKKRGRK